MENRVEQSLHGKNENYIFPFFWEHGEPHEILKQEIDKVCESNIRAICVEARPHPDFAGDHWWSDMDFILSEARARGLEVWLLDDDHFPTGHAVGVFEGGKHPLSNQFLACFCMDVVGPVKNGTVAMANVPFTDGEVVAAVACPRVEEGTTAVDVTKGVDVTGLIKNGWLRWNVPEGLWRVFLFYTTHRGNGKIDYFNILDSASVRMLIDQVYEPHYARYKDDFGKTFRGFFSDEPEFGNLPGYNFQARLGRQMKYIPWSGELEQRLRTRWGESFALYLPVLWYDAAEQEETGKIRYAYMDETTKQLKTAFADQLHDWCAERGVMHIGHIIEDDNSHGRLGCSTGHYFRSISGMGMAGIDVVLLQIMPGMDQTYHQWIASDRDGEFFHYGLARMGSSLAHVDPGKNGDSMCEIFGAYGWQEGISLMKWLADHMMVRGVNHFVPHAFSPKEYPDPDCPPHFYARGKNPQFPYFAGLMDYMNRICHLITGGRAVSQVAVLYHADAEWAGEAMLFQKPVRVLTEHQIDCDVVPADLFTTENPYGMSFDGRQIHVAKQSYEMLVIPGSKYLPEPVARFCQKALASGFPVIFAGRRPDYLCEDVHDEQALVDELKQCPVIPLHALGKAVKDKIVPTVETEDDQPKLRTYCHLTDSGLVVLCFNESTTQTLETKILIRGSASFAARYDAYENRLYRLPCEQKEGAVCVPLHLEVGEACVLVMTKSEADAPLYQAPAQVGEPVRGPWEVTFSEVGETVYRPLSRVEEGASFPDLTDWAVERQFCGTLRYETKIDSAKPCTESLRLPAAVDAAEVFVNGKSVGKRIGAPYCYPLPLREGENTVEIVLSTTPVYLTPDPRSAFTILPPLGIAEPPLRCRAAE